MNVDEMYDRIDAVIMNTFLNIITREPTSRSFHDMVNDVYFAESSPRRVYNKNRLPSAHTFDEIIEQVYCGTHRYFALQNTFRYFAPHVTREYVQNTVDVWYEREAWYRGLF